MPTVAAGLTQTIVLLERFDGLYGQDPFAYFYYSTGALRDSLLELRRPPPFFWPPGYPVFLSLVYRAMGERLFVVRVVQAILGTVR